MRRKFKDERSGDGPISRYPFGTRYICSLDVDFSKLQFKDLLIDKAGNDCLGLSYGVYRGKNLNPRRCGDKAVSVGETSKAILENVLARDSGIRLATKDFGSIELERGRIENTKNAMTCTIRSRNSLADP